MNPGHGAFRGITLQNQGAVQNNFMSTLDVQGMYVWIRAR